MYVIMKLGESFNKKFQFILKNIVIISDKKYKNILNKVTRLNKHNKSKVNKNDSMYKRFYDKYVQIIFDNF